MNTLLSINKRAPIFSLNKCTFPKKFSQKKVPVKKLQPKVRSPIKPFKQLAKRTGTNTTLATNRQTSKTKELSFPKRSSTKLQKYADSNQREFQKNIQILDPKSTSFEAPYAERVPDPRRRLDRMSQKLRKQLLGITPYDSENIATKIRTVTDPPPILRPEQMSRKPRKKSGKPLILDLPPREELEMIRELDSVEFFERRFDGVAALRDCLKTYTGYNFIDEKLIVSAFEQLVDGHKIASRNEGLFIPGKKLIYALSLDSLNRRFRSAPFEYQRSAVNEYVNSYLYKSALRFPFSAYINLYPTQVKLKDLPNESTVKASLLSNTVCNIAGLLLQEKGLNEARRYVRSQILSNSVLDGLLCHQDAKRKLWEYLTTWNKPAPIYEERGPIGSLESPLFLFGVYCGDQMVGVGSGQKKIEACARAAEEALIKFWKTPYVSEFFASNPYRKKESGDKVSV
eukprot:TRINITY_DN1934_c0_g1_i1.p1 TRINITY_DN1934_c0_g1~~TRINITY_DN1934_c0_g1_i1.p1  ORF type:complete len:456 (+),score=81.28 TRINITY_DN1934_c0_g1_i1:61-1428(+)